MLMPSTQHPKGQAGLGVLLPLSRGTGCVSAVDGFALPSVLWVHSGTHGRCNLSLLEPEVVCKLASAAAQWEQTCRVRQLVQRRRCLRYACLERGYTFNQLCSSVALPNLGYKQIIKSDQVASSPMNCGTDILGMPSHCKYKVKSVSPSSVDLENM